MKFFELYIHIVGSVLYNNFIDMNSTSNIVKDEIFPMIHEYAPDVSQES
jgi:hypothetical protein